MTFQLPPSIIDNLKFTGGTAIPPPVISSNGLGVGIGIEFEVQTTPAITKIGATIDCVATNITPGFESFDLVFSTLVSGVPTEQFRMSSLAGFIATIDGGSF